jgi:hypothetical protein
MLWTKRTKLLCTLPFLLRCRDHKTIPWFLQFCHHINSDPANRIYRCTSFFREWSHNTRHELGTVSRELLKLHLLLTHTLSAEDWDLIHHITDEQVLCIAGDVRAKHCMKFLQLHNTQHPPGTLNNSRTAIKLSGVPLEEAACSALSNGLNYAAAHGLIPIKDFLCNVEKVIGTLPEETAEEI